MFLTQLYHVRDQFSSYVSHPIREIILKLDSTEFNFKILISDWSKYEKYHSEIIVWISQGHMITYFDITGERRYQPLGMDMIFITMV